MPHLNVASRILWFAVIVAQPWLAFLLIRNGSWRQWPSLLAFGILHSVQSFSLLAIYLVLPHRAALYFYVYWSMSLVGVFIEAWMMAQIGGEMAGISSRARRLITQAISAALAFGFIVSAQLTRRANIRGFSNPHFPWWGVLSKSVLDMNRAVSLAWLLTFFLCVIAWEFFGLRCFGRVRGISAGYAIAALGWTATSWLLGIVRDVTFVSNLQDFIYLCSLIVWMVTLFSAQERLPDSSAESIASSLSVCVGAFQRIKARL